MFKRKETRLNSSSRSSDRIRGGWQRASVAVFLMCSKGLGEGWEYGPLWLLPRSATQYRHWIWIFYILMWSVCGDILSFISWRVKLSCKLLLWKGFLTTSISHLRNPINFWLRQVQYEEMRKLKRSNLRTVDSNIFRRLFMRRNWKLITLYETPSQLF